MANDKKRQMTLVAFLQAQNCSNYVGSWRHPQTLGDFMSPGYYQHIARVLEAGKFDMAFFDDRLALPDKLGNDHREAIRHGVRVVKMDPVTIATAMGLATEKLGLGATYSTTYYEPFHVARVFATLDLMLKGRAAWNVVTSLNDSEAANFGHAEHLGHDARYDRADEFMEVVMGHWDTWEEGAIKLDRANGVFADPDRIHSLNHKGKFFSSKGPFTVPRSAQGHPVLIQAGQSGRGRSFAARWAELIFVIFANLDVAKKGYRDVKAAIAAAGRDPDKVKLAPAVYVVPAATQAEAEDKAAVIEKLAHPVDSLSLLSEVLNFDFASKPLDEPFTDQELASISGLQAIRDRVTQLSGNPHPSTRDFIKFSGRGTVREFPFFVGTPQKIADQFEQWFDGGCDGFVISATHMPGSYEDFVALVVPELQRRGLFRKEYTGNTLRDHLGLAPPEIGAWKRLGG